MKVEELMCEDVEMVASDATVAAAAQKMAERNIGFLPVSRDDKLVGALTDRDIVTRVVAAGRDPGATIVQDVMTADAKYCYRDEDVGHVADNMGQIGVCRLAVMDRDKQLVGVVSIGSIVPQGPDRAGARALAGLD